MPTIGLAQLDQFTDIIHDYYIPGLVNQFPYEVSLWGEMTEKPVDGKRFEIRHELGANQRGGFRNEREILPAAAGDLYKLSYDNTKYAYAPIDVTGPMLNETKGKRQFVDLVGRRFKTTGEAFIQTLDRVTWMNGSGQIARCNGTATYDASTGLTTVTYDTAMSSFNILDHMLVNFGTDTDGYEVVEVDHGDDGVTFDVLGDAHLVAVDNAYIYNHKGYEANLYREPIGIDGHVNDEDPPAVAEGYQNLSRADYPWLRAYMKNQNGVITSLAMKKFIDRIRIQSMKVPNKFIMNEGVYNAWMSLLESKHQSVSMVVNNLGFSQLMYTYRGKQIKLETADRCPDGYLYALNTEYLEKRVSRPLGWDTSLGNQRMTRKTDYDIYQGWLAIYFNTLCTMCKAQGAMYNITHDVIS